MPLIAVGAEDFGLKKVIKHCGNQPFIDDESHGIFRENGAGETQIILQATLSRSPYRVGSIRH
jgi:hypothetical protein